MSKTGHVMCQLFERLLQGIDRLARSWLNERAHQASERYAAAEDVQLTRFEFENGKVSGSYISEQAVFLAENLGQMLSEAGAENYVQMDIMPHMTSKFRPIRVTVQWRDGLSPAEKNVALQNELRRAKDRLKEQDDLIDAIHKIGMQQAAEWDRFWEAMGVHSEEITVDQAIAKWQAYDAVVNAARATRMARFKQASHESLCQRCREVGENGVCDVGSELYLAQFRATKTEHDALSALDQLGGSA